MKQLLTFCLICCCSGGLLQAQQERISEPLRYEGYSEAEYKSWTRQSQYVEMPDGVKLAVDILTPAKGPERDTWPVILQCTPYHRSYILPKMGPLKHVASSVLGLGWGPTYDQSIIPYVSTMLKHGYVVVTADMRGTGASFGTQIPLMPQLADDGKALVDWIEKQPWSNGNVGMMGPSYLGWVQYLTAARKPKALKCIMPEVVFADVYSEINYPGGIGTLRWRKDFSDLLRALNLNVFDFKERHLPAMPVIDEDGDGKLQDERPVLDSATLYLGQAPRYLDKAARTQHWYLQATRAHLRNGRVRELMEHDLRYYDSPGPAPFDTLSYQLSSPLYAAPEIVTSGIPVYQVGGWMDIFSRGPVKLHSTLAPHTFSKLLMQPRFHLGITKSYRKYLDYEGKTLAQSTLERLRFFDHFLKGIDNGIDQEPPIYLYVMHEGYRAEENWPLEREQLTPFYLSASGKLAQAVGEVAQDTYVVDFTAHTGYGKDSLNRWTISEGTPRDVMMRTEKDRQCIVYETPPLQEAVEVTGHPQVELWLSANQADVDVYVYVCEVAPTGESVYVTEGQLRAGFHRRFDDDTQTNYRMEVKPDLPWHGYYESQYDPQPLADGKICKLSFDLMPVAWKFRPGYRIRIAIAGADAGHFELNPHLCPDGTIGSCPDTEFYLHRGGERASRVVLPIIPAESKRKMGDNPQQFSLPMNE